MNNYCLVARNKKDNSFKIIGIKECWYRTDGDSENFSYMNSLGSIDLVTTRFRSREEMAKRLSDRGYIDGEDYDFFIASKARSGSSNPVKCQEVIYRPEKNERMAEFRTVAAASHLGRLPEANDKVLRIFNKLLTKAYHRGDYYFMIQNGYTGLPKKLVDAMVGMREKRDVPYSLKYDQRWALESYPVIRNIVESLNRFDYVTANYDNMVQGNIAYFNDNARGRRSICPKLERILDKDYAVGQIDMFDSSISDAFAVPRTDVVEPVKEEVKPKKTFPVIEGITDENRLSKVMQFLTSIPLESFKYVDNKLTFDFSVFDYELDDGTKKKLNSLMTGSLRNNVRLYLFHKLKFNEAKDEYGHDKFILQADMDADYRDIASLLKKNENRLKRVAEWCRIYSACGQMNEMMAQQDSQYGDDAVSKKKS